MIVVHSIQKSGSSSVSRFLGSDTIHVHRLAHPNTDFEKKFGQFRRVEYGITLFRDPIGRNLSFFFNQQFRNRDWPRDEWTDHFIDKFDHDDVAQYFDEEIQPFWDVDVYKYPWIDPWLKLGRLLILKFECIEEWHRPLKMLLGCDGSCCLHKKFQNVNPTKYPFEIENQLPAEFVEAMYDTKFAKHFYNPEEIERFKERWKMQTQLA